MKFQDLKTKSKVLIGICSPMVLLVILGGVATLSIKDIVATNKLVNHTQEALADTAAIVGSAVDMETGMRGYLLAGKEEFLSPYTSGETQTYANIKALQQVVNDDPKQVKLLDEARIVLQEWQSEVTEPTIELRRQIGNAKTMNDMAHLVAEAKGKVFFDKFRSQINTFIEREATLLATRRTDFEAARDLVNEKFSLTFTWVSFTANQ